MAQGGLPGVASVSGRGQIDFHAFAIHGHPGQGHVVLPADEPSHSAQLRLEHDQGAAVSFTPDQPLGSGGFELAVFAQESPIRAEVEQGAVEGAPTELGVPFDDADGQIGSSPTGSPCQGLCNRTGHIDGIGPVALPQTPSRGAPSADHGAKAKPPWVGRDKGFREEDQFCALCCGFFGQATGLLNSGLTVEEDWGSLKDRDSNPGQGVGHFSPLTLSVKPL